MGRRARLAQAVACGDEFPTLRRLRCHRWKGSPGAEACRAVAFLETRSSSPRNSERRIAVRSADGRERT